MSTIEPVFRIIPTTQNYDWGKKGSDSKVAEFASGAGIPGYTLNESAPYAEVGDPEARSATDLTNERTMTLALDGHACEVTVRSG
jgi:hypothetical protein